MPEPKIFNAFLSYARHDAEADSRLFSEFTTTLETRVNKRLYVQGKRGRIEFGVRRAFISISNAGPGQLSKVDGLRASGDGRNSYYATFHDAPDAITVCMDPPEGKSSLGDLPLPPSENENRLSRVAIASPGVSAGQLNAKLVTLLNAEGLYLVGASQAISSQAEAAIKAIMNVAQAKGAQTGNQAIGSDGVSRRSLPIRERS